MRKLLLMVVACASVLPTVHAAAPDKGAAIGRLMTQYHALGQLDGAVLVAEKGKVVYQHAFGQANREWSVPHTTDSVFRIASLTKQFTATMVLQLAEQGKLRLDDKIGRYVPDLKPEIGERVTLAQLMNHTSGIVDYANFPGFWANRLGEKVPRADYLAIMNRDLEFAPGTQGHYSSSGYTLLGWVIEHVTGKSYGEALEAMITKPLGMARTMYDAPELVVPRKASGYARVLGQYQPAAPLWIPNIGAGGGMVSTVGDFFKWDQALYGSKVLSEASKRLMWTSSIKDDVWGDLHYGYGWLAGQRQIAGKARKVHEHGGNGNGFRTLVTRYPDEQRLVVVFLNEGNGNKGPGIYRIKDSITKVLYGEAAPMPRADFADALVAAIDKVGLAKAIAGADALRNSAMPLSGPDELNMLGYMYAGTGRYKEAMAVLQLDAAWFPADGNIWDTMGELQLKQGDKAAAVKSYRRSLELDPKNTNAVEVLRVIEQQGKK
jgi:CubicO group peptidase (beta-lactamase class C family)